MAPDPDTTTDPRPDADRDPTPDEAAAAERGAETIDTDSVGEHYEEMTELGANIKGEGQIDRS